METKKLDPIVKAAVDAEWAIDAALAILNTSDRVHVLDQLAYARAIDEYAVLAKRVVTRGLQAEYRQARIDRINDLLRGKYLATRDLGR